MAAYAFAIFTGAFLLFQVQPLIGKYLLPWFGGGPGVWTTCLVFFQVLLLGGYLYAHLSQRFLKPRLQVILHMILLGCALATLPIIPNDSWKQPATAEDPTFRMLALLLLSVGLPYFVLSATAPLLQHWFSRSHPGRAPFRLYALSNAGSLLALLSYPTVFEIWFRRNTQAYVWGAGLGLYALACAVCAARLWKVSGSRAPGVRVVQARSNSEPFEVNQSSPLPSVAGTCSPPAMARAPLLWLLFSACASVLLLAVTNKMCEDVAVVPFLWVLPLSAYLLSFIVSFERPQWYVRLWFGPALAVALAGMAWMLAGSSSFAAPVQVLIYVSGLFICCTVCHGEIYRLKPAADELTRFYLTIASGGALGGTFVAVFAPRLFGDFYELHWALIACGALFLLVCARSGKQQRFPPTLLGACTAGWVALVAIGWWLWTGAHKSESVRVFRVRNFYGVLNVYRHENANPKLSFVELVHGRIAHGMQFLDPTRVDQPTLYYSRRSGIDLALRTLSSGPRRIGVVGLGAGTLATYGRAGDQFRFYEINPRVEQVARKYFSFLKTCPAHTDVVLGDARLSLEREPPQHFDLLALDAFSSDSIPTHLLTREAFRIYEKHLKPAGVVAVHISNACLNLEPVLARLAAELGYSTRVVEQQIDDESQGILSSVWFLLCRNSSFADEPQIGSPGRSPVSVESRAPLWTDDYCALFGLLRWRELLDNGQSEERQRAIATHSNPPLQKGGLASQIAGFRERLKREPDSTVALNNLAFLLATAPDPALRNGTEAVSLAERSCALTCHTNVATLGTLAAAYAEAGRFEDAQTTEEKICKLAADASNPALLQYNLHLLELYQRKQPFHQQSEIEAKAPKQ